MPPEPPQPDLRASDADREATADRLRTAAMEGRLDSDELEERMSAAYGARWCSELQRLTTDLVPPASPPTPPAAAPRFVHRGTRVNGLAIVSLICGILWMGWIGSAAAIALGHVALHQIARSGGSQTGRGLAIGGLALGYLGALTFVLAMLGAVLG